jgi:hypothetical protein
MKHVGARTGALAAVAVESESLDKSYLWNSHRLNYFPMSNSLCIAHSWLTSAGPDWAEYSVSGVSSSKALILIRICR